MKKAKCCLFEWSKKCPPVLDGPKQRTGAKHIGTHKGIRIKNASVDMAFRSKVDYRIGPVHLEKRGNKFRVSNIAELRDALREAMKRTGPVLIDAQIDKDERVLPMIPAGGTIDDLVVD